VVNLVHAEEVSYVENQGDMGEDLENLTFMNDGKLDGVHDLRDTYGADFVSLFALSTSSGGIAWLLNDTSGRPDRAFNVNRVQQTDFSYTTVHELGHNMGCGHSATQYTQQGPGLYSYSSGWQWSAAGGGTIGYCSVMTYENFDGVGDGSQLSHYEYERVPYFSNPSISYLGNVTGNAANGDNARTIRNVRHVVGDYRASVVFDSDSDGITDAWEELYYGSITGAVAGVDTDGDGTDNYSEYIAGTDPTNSASVFIVTDFEVFPSEAGRIITWNSVEGRVYNVLWTDNLVYTPFANHNLSGDLPYPVNSFTDTVDHAAGQNFYRVDVRLGQ